MAIPPSLMFTTWQTRFLPLINTMAAIVTGQRKERRRSRTINPNAAFKVRPTEVTESGFSITKFG